MIPRPLRFRFEAGRMVPLAPDAAARAYTEGECYRLVQWEDRSANTHRHFFACVKAAFDNLPESLADQFATPDHLRKWCLIKTGFRDESTIALPTKADAQRVAAWAKPGDDFAIFVVREAAVIRMTAKSQSLRAMGKDEFRRSKDAVLDELAKMLGTNTTTLMQNAGQAA